MNTIAFLVILLSAAVYSVPLESCGDDEGVPSLPKSVYIYKCPSFPCTFVYGGHITGVYSEFINSTVGAPLNELEMEIKAEQGGETHHITVESVNRCTGIPDAECKVDGDSANFYFMFHVYLETQEEEILPFKLSMKNKNGTVLSCAKFTAKIAPQPVTITDMPKTTATQEDH